MKCHLCRIQFPYTIQYQGYGQWGQQAKHKYKSQFIGLTPRTFLQKGQTRQLKCHMLQARTQEMTKPPTTHSTSGNTTQPWGQSSSK